MSNKFSCSISAAYRHIQEHDQFPVGGNQTIATSPSHATKVITDRWETLERE
jgi:hypothetical protein